MLPALFYITYFWYYMNEINEFTSPTICRCEYLYVCACTNSNIFVFVVTPNGNKENIKKLTLKVFPDTLFLQNYQPYFFISCVITQCFNYILRFI